MVQFNKNEMYIIERTADTSATVLMHNVLKGIEVYNETEVEKNRISIGIFIDENLDAMNVWNGIRAICEKERLK